MNRALGALIVLLVTAPLGACGFTPLYATPGLAPALAEVDVVTPRDRVGYLLQEQLGDELGHAQGVAPRYQLVCTTRRIRIPRGVRVNNVANRYEINLTVDYALKAAGGVHVLLQGSAPVIVDYDSPDAPYAAVAAERDGEVRAANQAAVQIRLALSRYFAGLHAGSHPVETPSPATDLADPP
jgi:LPS-assembly lipoprotein